MLEITDMEQEPKSTVRGSRRTSRAGSRAPTGGAVRRSEDADEGELELEDSESGPVSEPWLLEPLSPRSEIRGLRDRERPERLPPRSGVERERSSRRLDLGSRDRLRSGISIGPSESTSASDALSRR